MQVVIIYRYAYCSAVSCGRHDTSNCTRAIYCSRSGKPWKMTEAITAATGEAQRLNYSHVGIAVPVCGGRFRAGSHK